jgi:hypothetical protein
VIYSFGKDPHIDAAQAPNDDRTLSKTPKESLRSFPQVRVTDKWQREMGWHIWLSPDIML